MSGNQQNPDPLTVPGNASAAGLADTPERSLANGGPTLAQASPSRTRRRKDRPSLQLSEAQADVYEETLRGRLGLLPKGVKLPVRIRRRGWIATAIAAVIAFVARFWNLNHPRAIVFDETYYVKGAFSLLTRGYEGRWTGGDKTNDLFVKGDYSVLTSDPDRVVHPPFGKWIMAIGQRLFGTDNGVGWRFSTAFIGVLTVILVARIAMRMFRSPILTGFAGIAIALDGMGIVLSRTGILDNILGFFALMGFWAILMDRERHAGQLAHRVAHGRFRDTEHTRTVIASGRFDGRALPTVDPWGPGHFARPWLVLAGVLLGLTCAVKWSGIYALAVFGLLTLALGAVSRKIAGVPLWFGGATFRDGIPAFIQLVPVALVAYLAGWTSWFLNPHSWGRNWVAEARKTGEDLPLSWAPDIVNSFIHYHQDMWSFHHSLSETHTYQSQAWEWIFQGRPVNFYWEEKGAPRTCGASKCVQAITSIGNVGVWWLAIVGLVIVLIAAIFRADWRSWAIIAGYAGLWMPWLLYTNRTIFQFYAVAFLPYTVLALTFGVAAASQLLGPARTRLQPQSALKGAASFVPEPLRVASKELARQDSRELARQKEPTREQPGRTRENAVPSGPADHAPELLEHTMGDPTDDSGFTRRFPNFHRFLDNLFDDGPNGNSSAPQSNSTPEPEAASSQTSQTPPPPSPSFEAPAGESSAVQAAAETSEGEEEAFEGQTSEGSEGEDVEPASDEASSSAPEEESASAPAEESKESAPAEEGETRQAERREAEGPFQSAGDRAEASSPSDPPVPGDFQVPAPSHLPAPASGDPQTSVPEGAAADPIPAESAFPQAPVPGSSPVATPGSLQLSAPSGFPPPVPASQALGGQTGAEEEAGGSAWWMPRKPRLASWIVLGVVTGVIVAAAVFWYPLWTGRTITYDFWRLHMWFGSWI